MVNLIKRINLAKLYKGRVVGPVSNELFKGCHFEDCIIFECRTCRFDGCTFLRCSTTSFHECVITFCRFENTDLRTGMACLVQDSSLEQSDITDESVGNFQDIKTAGFYSIRTEYQSFIGSGCSIIRNRVTAGEIKLQGSGHKSIGNFVDDPEQATITMTALTNEPIKA